MRHVLVASPKVRSRSSDRRSHHPTPWELERHPPRIFGGLGLGPHLQQAKVRGQMALFQEGQLLCLAESSSSKPVGIGLANETRASADEGVADVQAGETAEIAVGGPEFLDTMLQAERNDARIVHARTGDATGLE